MNSVRSKAVYWVLALLLAAPLLFFALRGIQWARVRETMAGAQAGHMALGCAVMTAALLPRSMRWRLLLLAEGHVTLATAFWATSAGYFGNNFLPARAGELVRTMMVSNRAHLSRTYVLTTALAERIVDAIALVVISTTAISLLPSNVEWLQKAARPFTIAGLAGLAAIIILPYTQQVCIRFIGALPLPPRIHDKVQALVGHVLRGIRSFHQPRRMMAFLFLTAFIWCMDAVIVVTVAQGLGLTMSLPVSFLLIAALGLGSALPSTPGYVGVYQFVAVAVLTPFGFDRDDAIAFILMYQVLQYALYGVLGLTALAVARTSGQQSNTVAT